jgi:hypothetical protein
VHERGGLEGVARGLAEQFGGGELAQLAVDERQQIRGGGRVAGVGLREQERDLAHEVPEEGRFWGCTGQNPDSAGRRHDGVSSSAGDTTRRLAELPVASSAVSIVTEAGELPAAAAVVDRAMVRAPRHGREGNNCLALAACRRTPSLKISHSFV